MSERLIIELPTSLSASIVSEWMGVPDRVRLDSAHCQASIREEFLQLIRSPELSVKSWVRANKALVSWALLREVFVDKVSIEGESDFDLYNSYLQKFASGIFVLRLNCSTCHNLLIVNICNWKPLASLRDVFKCCTRLREFCGHFCPEQTVLPLTSEHLQSLVCSNLKYLELAHAGVDLVTAFLGMAVAVEVVVLYPAAISLNGILESMSQTTNTLSLDGITMNESMANFATRCERIENLSIQWSYITEGAVGCFCKFPNLRALDLTGSEFDSAEDCMKVLASCCGDKLTELLLCYCKPSLSLESVLTVLPYFTQLNSFSNCFDEADIVECDMSPLADFLSSTFTIAARTKID